MKIWIVTVGEPLPIDGKRERLYRSGILSQLMADEGHEVTWWSSSFNHTKKKQRVVRDTIFQVKENLKLTLIVEPGYKKTISFRRIASQSIFAIRFKKKAMSADPPNLILVSYPTIELGVAAIALGRRMDVPVVVDIRDLWPDIFLGSIPRYLRPLGKLCLVPYDYMARKVLREANAVIGITERIRDWGLEKCGREEGRFDKSFPMGYEDIQLSKNERTAAQKFWRQLGVSENNWNICFFGAIGKQAKFETVFQAAKIIENTCPTVKFIICGTGENQHSLVEKSRELANILLPGWVDRTQINTLMKMSQLGLTVYPATKDFLMSIPNKPIEYMSAGLPILSNIDGVLGSLVEKHGIGIVHNSQDAKILANEIERLVASPDLMSKMKRASQSLFDKEYRADFVYGNYSRCLQEVEQNWRRQT